MSIPLSSIRTDGWFDRVAQKIGSFQVLCDVLGERFFAFSLITGAQVTSLTVDRRTPSQSIVEFALPGQLAKSAEATQKLTLASYREYLVAQLLDEDDWTDKPPTRPDDLDATQYYLGARLLLLAPLFGYGLLALNIAGSDATLRFVHGQEERELPLSEFRDVIHRWVHEELERAREEFDNGATQLDLRALREARVAAEQGDSRKVVGLLGGWLMPLSFLLRTPEGRLLPPERRADLADALGLLGHALIEEGEAEAGPQCLRLSVQYALGSDAAGNAYARLGDALSSAEAYGQAIAPLRRAAKLGADPERVWPALSNAFFEEGRYLAAWGALSCGASAGVDEARLEPLRQQILQRVPLLAQWQQLVHAPSEHAS